MRKLCILLLIILYPMLSMAHSSFIMHGEDIMAVLGFEYNTKLFSRNRDTKSNDSWVKYISSDMIDNTSFHKQLENIYPGIGLSTPNTHRYLFHWPYEAKPWSECLERHIRNYCQEKSLNENEVIDDIKFRVKSEQSRRNRDMENRTAQVFGLRNGGVEGAYVKFLISTAYNVHLLGDYQSGNSIFDGVIDLQYIIGNIIITLQRLDSQGCKSLQKEITRINHLYTENTTKADHLMEYLKKSVPLFIKKARDGSVYRLLQSKGFRFVV